MIKLKTIGAVDYNTGRLVGASNGILFMDITAFNYTTRSGERVEVEYLYKEESGDTLKVGVEVLEKDDINTLFDTIKPMIPANTSFTDTFLLAVKFGAIIKFAETFQLQVSDIEENLN